MLCETGEIVCVRSKIERKRRAKTWRGLIGVSVSERAIRCCLFNIITIAHVKHAQCESLK